MPVPVDPFSFAPNTTAASAQVNARFAPLYAALSGALDSTNMAQPPVTAAETGLKIIRGRVSIAGAILSGAGFTVTKGSAGVYTLNFTAPFSSRPSITAIAETVGDASIASTGSTGGSETLAIYRNASAVYADASFHFIAIGPS